MYMRASPAPDHWVGWQMGPQYYLIFPVLPTSTCEPSLLTSSRLKECMAPLLVPTQKRKQTLWCLPRCVLLSVYRVGDTA
jgi:hypothetical protein